MRELMMEYHTLTEIGGGWYEQARKFNFHFWLATTMKAIYRDAQLNPLPGITYASWDMEDFLLLLFPPQKILERKMPVLVIFSGLTKQRTFDQPAQDRKFPDLGKHC